MPATREADIRWLREEFIPRLRTRMETIFDQGFVSTSTFPHGVMEAHEIVTIYEEDDGIGVRVALSTDDYEKFFAAALRALGMRDAEWKLMEEGIMSFVGKALLHREDLPLQARKTLNMFVEMPRRLKEAYDAIGEMLQKTPEFRTQADLPESSRWVEPRIYAEMVGGAEPSGVLDGHSVWFSYRVTVPTFSKCPRCNEFTPRRPDNLSSGLLICRYCKPTVYLEDSVLDASIDLPDGIHFLHASEKNVLLVRELRVVTEHFLEGLDPERAAISEAYPIAQEFENGRESVYVAVSGSRVVGYALWRYFDYHKSTDPYLAMILVDEAHRRAGWGKALLEFGRDYETFPDNPQWGCGAPTEALAGLLRKMGLTGPDGESVDQHFTVYWGIS